MKIIFMGSDEIALGILNFLREKGELIVVSQPDKPSGRGQKLTPNAISSWALENNLKLLRPEKLDENFLAELKAFVPDIVFVMAYGRILKQAFIDLPPLGTWNFHASLLPKLRGASPIETAIAIGEKETGVCLMKMVLALDAGDIGALEKVAIDNTMTATMLREEIARASERLLVNNWERLAAGKIDATPQNAAEVTFCRPFTKDDTLLDVNAPAAEICLRVRAFAEKPGVAFIYNNERLKVFKAIEVKTDERPLIDNQKMNAGTIIESAERLRILTGVGVLEILELQKPGGKRLKAKDFLRGYPIKAGDKLTGGAHRPIAHNKPFPRGY